MKRFVAILTLFFVAFSAVAQSENSIIIDQNSFRPLQSDALTGVNIDPIGVDSSRRPCARIKMKINRMSREDIDKLEVKIHSNNQLTKCKTAEYDNGLIIEMTAKNETRFYFHHPEFGYSNEVNIDLEPNKEYYMEAYLNQQLSITIISDVVGADVYLDGIFVGKTNPNKMIVAHSISSSKHLLRLEYSGKSFNQEINANRENLVFVQNVLDNLYQKTPIIKSQSKSSIKGQITSPPYKIGDYYNNGTKEGVVFDVSADGMSGKIVSMTQTKLAWSIKKQCKTVGTSSANNGIANLTIIKSIPDWEIVHPAFKWCSDLGKDWYLPSVDELKVVMLNKSTHDAVNHTLDINEGTKLYSVGEKAGYWSSSENSDGFAYIAVMGGSGEISEYGWKNTDLWVRPVAVFDDKIYGHKSKSLNLTSAPYKVGHYYNDGEKEGIVFEVSEDGFHGKIVSLTQSSIEISWSLVTKEKQRVGADSKNNGMHNMAIIKTIPNWQQKFPAFDWCANLGADWYLPSIEELKTFTIDRSVYHKINHTLKAHNGDTLGYTFIARGGVEFKDFYNYWSSTEITEINKKQKAWYAVLSTENDFFLNHEVHSNSKTSKNYVRAVAKF